MNNAAFETVRRKLSGRKNKTVHNPRLSPAAVLFPLFWKNGEYTVLFHRRTESVAHHKGEISLPGGAVEPSDESPWHAALREAWEEMGIRPRDVAFLGELDPVATRSGFLIDPFVVSIPYPYPFRVNPEEVAEVLEVPVRALSNPDNWREEIQWLDGKPTKLYAYAYGASLIYGATAKIVRQFLQKAGDVLTEGDLVARA